MQDGKQATGEPAAETLRIGHCEVDLRERVVQVDGQPAKLGARAFDVLAALAAQRGRTVSKAALLEQVWPDVVVEENNLQVQVSSLRKLLGPDAISTIPGRGYRLAPAPRAVTDTRVADGAGRAQEATAGSAGVGPAPGRGTSARPGAVASGGSSDAVWPDENQRSLPPGPPILIGRDDDLASLASLVESFPLVTLTGAGGIGKTALALAVAQRLRRRWPDGAAVVELAPVASAADLADTVAHALRTTLTGDADRAGQLVRHLASQSLLLVLDNAEHLVDAVAALAESIATQAPDVHLLVTSQELLHVPHERLYPLAPLRMPPEGEPAQAERDAAVALFVDRARAVDPRFRITPENARAVAQICRQLDGLPLAIELAAARVRHVGALGLRDMLGDRFRVLTGGTRAALPRQRTLRATIEWSHGLLAPEEQLVLRRLGVFVGGFTLDLAQAVACDDDVDTWGALDALSHLVDKSLVMADGGEPPRYHLLESTRAFALEQLAEAGTTDALRQRHARAVCTLFEQADAEHFGDGGTLDASAYAARLRPELDNLRAAMAWALGDGQDCVLAATLAAASAELLRKDGLSEQALAWMLALDTALPPELPEATQGLFWLRLASLGVNGRLPTGEATEMGRRSVELYRRIGAPRRLHHALYVVAWTLVEGGAPEKAEPVIEEMVGLEQPDWPVRCTSLRLNVQASMLRQQDRSEEALQTWRKMLELQRHEPGEDATLAAAQTNLCFVLNHLRRFEETLTLAQEFLHPGQGRRRYGLPYLLTHMLVAQLRLGRVDDARATMRVAVPEWRRDSALPSKCCELALLFARLGRMADAARLDGAAAAFSRSSGYRANALADEARERTQALFDEAALDPDDLAHWRREGAQLDGPAIAALCLAAEGPDPRHARR